MMTAQTCLPTLVRDSTITALGSHQLAAATSVQTSFQVQADTRRCSLCAKRTFSNKLFNSSMSTFSAPHTNSTPSLANASSDLDRVGVILAALPRLI